MADSVTVTREMPTTVVFECGGGGGYEVDRTPLWSKASGSNAEPGTVTDLQETPHLTPHLQRVSLAADCNFLI